MEKTEKKENFYLKLFIVFIILSFLISDIEFILNYSIMPNISFISKAFSILLFFLSFIYIIINGRFKMFSQSYTLIVFAMVALLIGSIKNGINIGTFSHMYSFIMPITVSSIGYYYARNYDNSGKMRKFTNKYLKLLTIIEFSLVLLYIALRNSGNFHANSFGPRGLIFTSLFFLANKNYKFSLLSIIGIILSNKRSSVLIIGVGLLYYLYYISRGKLTKKIRNIVLIVILSVLLVLIYNYTGYLNRFKVFFEMDFSNINSIHSATSYRTLEMERVIRYLFESANNFLFGSGFGGEIFSRSEYVRYIHFSPLNYAFISGVPFAVLMYTFFIIDTLKIKRKKSIQLLWIDVLWIAYFVLTFTAATVATNILTWFILGGLKYSIKTSGKNCCAINES